MKAKSEIDFDTYRGYMRSHTVAEQASFEAFLRIYGSRDPLIVGILDGKKYLIDGFNRKHYFDREGIDYRFEEMPFDSEEAMCDWIEDNQGGHRNATRTDRNYDIGRKYLRRKKGDGNGRPEGSKNRGKKVPTNSTDSTASTIAAEQRCSDKHVKNCAKMVRHIEEACSCGLGFLKDPIRKEQIKYGKKLLDELINLGAGGCKEQILQLLAENDKISPKKIREALDIANEKEEDDDSDKEQEPTAAAIPIRAMLVKAQQQFNGNRLKMYSHTIRSWLDMLEKGTLQ